MKYSFLLLLIVTGLHLYSQQTNGAFAETAFVYKYFGSGGTTASLWFYSKAVDTMRKVTRSQLNTRSLDTLNFLIAHVKSQRHFQQKVGPSFYAAIIKKNKERRLAVVPGWAIIDLANKRQYVFRDTPYFGMYNRFVDENYR